MTNAPCMRFPIRFERWYSVLSSALLLRPADFYVEVRDGEVECRMGWAFHARFPRSTVARTAPPVFEKYGAPDEVAKRFMDRVAKLLGGDFGR